MANRRLGKSSRAHSKKRSKGSKKVTIGSDVSTVKTPAAAIHRYTSRGKPMKHKGRQNSVTSLQKKRSALLKQQAVERMVLKEHTRELESRRARTRRGDSAKTERRELGKYIRQLKEEQRVKHSSELRSVEEAVKELLQTKAAACQSEEDARWEDIDSDEAEKELLGLGEEELQRMFAHLTT